MIVQFVGLGDPREVTVRNHTLVPASVDDSGRDGEQAWRRNQIVRLGQRNLSERYTNNDHRCVPEEGKNGT